MSSVNNSNSACTLKDIIDSLDDLSMQDLYLLQELISRILSCRS